MSYSVSFINSEMRRSFTYDNVIELNFRKERVIIKCREENNDIFCTAILEDEYNKIVLTKEV